MSQREPRDYQKQSRGEDQERAKKHENHAVSIRCLLTDHS